MRRIIVLEAIALDGYFADPGGALDWQPLDDEFTAHAVELLDSVDTLLLGRGTYELMTAWWPTSTGEGYSPEIATRINAATKLVVSSKPLDLSWTNTHQLGNDLPKSVAELKAGPGKYVRRTPLKFYELSDNLKAPPDIVA